jgi:hypothetical protein
MVVLYHRVKVCGNLYVGDRARVEYPAGRWRVGRCWVSTTPHSSHVPGTGPVPSGKTGTVAESGYADEEQERAELSDYFTLESPVKGKVSEFFTHLV